MVVIATAVNAACSLLVDMDGLAGAPLPTDAGSADARVAEIDGSREEPRGDAATDAATDARDGAAPACVGVGWFCDDFEGPFGAKWASNEASGGTVERVADAKTGAFGMQARVDAVAGAKYANLIRPLDAVPSRFACDFDVKLNAVPTTGEIDIFDMKRIVGDTKHSLYLAAFDGKWGVYELVETKTASVVDRGATTALTPAMGQWMHVRFETDFATLTLSVDGSPAATLAGLTPVAGAASSHLAVGLPFALGAEAASVVFDNLVCALPP